jgi:aminoglycoside phosphotransferase (APT) family kinase protein
MPESHEDEKFAQVVRRINPSSTLLRTWVLQGGISAQVTALEVTRPDGQTEKLILRRHGEINRQQNPHIAAAEFRLLERLHDSGLPVPKPCFVDASCEIFPIPYIVVECIEGATEFAPVDVQAFIRQMAVNLACIHSVDSADMTFLPQQAAIYTERFRVRPINVDESLDEGRIRDVLEAVWPLPQVNPSTLLHGDYWPGNLLWRGTQLVGVVDWEDARIGDPLADLANTRLELLWAFDIDAMNHFTAQYQAIMTYLDYANLLYWDLCAALRPAHRIDEWAGSAAREKIMRERHKQFVAQALGKLSVQ